MKPNNQTQIHIEGKQNGDCWRACISSILNCDINDFPVQRIDQEWREYAIEICEILSRKGWGMVHSKIDGYFNLKTPDTDGYVIAIGESPRSTPENKISHAVVWKNGIVFDPNPDKNGLVSITAFEIYYKEK